MSEAEKASDGRLRFHMPEDDLCERLGGGLPSGALIVIAGPNGSGKSVLSQRVLYGLLHNGHSISYVSTELTTKGFLAQMSSLGYSDIRSHIPLEELIFIPTHPAIGHRAPREERLRRLVKARRMYEKDVVLFDAFSKFLGDHMRDRITDPAALDEVEAVLHLFKRMTSVGKTIVLTLDPAQADPSLLEPFLDEADILLRLEKEIVGTSGVRRIVVERMSRATSRYNEVIGYRVEPGIGIVIEIKAVVG